MANELIDIEEEYRKLAEEVKSFEVEVEQALQGNHEIRELYKGFRILYSNLIFRPTIMFIGINPGDWAKERCNSFDPEEKLEYINPEVNDYQLARQTVDLFKQINRLEILESNAIKTNFFYLATSREKDIYSITDSLGRGGELLGERIFKNAAKWTRKLIDISNPKIIICEGKISYSNVLSLFDEDYEQENGWNESNGNCGYAKLRNKDLVIVGYSRFRSYIRNKESLSLLLTELL